ncbi:hypothetical protein CDL15_Pgr005270 [Punica granatum]|uniref:Uncharacterized protein n=1 Tax=Punica granatum TaxID=22663 RepID=A0A218X5L2_PUNGR|nr:hypothetical protein CDL15_Pgr005270 [Punica granatum]
MTLEGQGRHPGRTQLNRMARDGFSKLARMFSTTKGMLNKPVKFRLKRTGREEPLEHVGTTRLSRGRKEDA